MAELEAQIRLEPENLGLQLDLAIALCLDDEAGAAQRLFLLLDSRPDLPRNIADVITAYRQSPICQEPINRFNPLPRGFVAAGGGRGRNINLGPTAERFFVSGLGQEVELADLSRPISARVGQAEAGATWSLPRWGGRGSQQAFNVYATAQRFQGQPQYGLNGLNAIWTWSSRDREDRSADAAIGAAQLTLGDQTRLHAQTFHFGRLWPLSPDATGDGSSRASAWSWGPAATLTLLDYAQRAALDARQLDVRARLRWEGPAARMSNEWGWLEDREVRDRPGGNRAGAFWLVQGAWAWPNGWSVESQWRLGRTADERAYSPAVFGDVARATRSQSAHVLIRRKLAHGLQLRLEQRWVQAQDRIALFTYRSSSTVLWLEAAFGQGNR